MTKDELQKKAASFLRATQQSYEPGWDQAMEDNADGYDWGSFDDTLDAADAAAAGC